MSTSPGSETSAFLRGACLSFAGQTSMHKPQPVQSSGATCTAYLWPENAGSNVSGTERNPAGAPSACSGAKTFVRMAA